MVGGCVECHLGVIAKFEICIVSEVAHLFLSLHSGSRVSHSSPCSSECKMMLISRYSLLYYNSCFG